MSIRFTERRGKKTVRFDGGTNVGGPQEDWSWEADRQGSQDSATKDSGIDTSSTFTSSEDSNRGDLPKVRARYGPTRVDRSCINQHFRKNIITCLSIDEQHEQKKARVPSISLSLWVRVLSRAQWKRKKERKKKKKHGQASRFRSDQSYTHRMDECSRVVDSSKRGLCRASESRTMNKRTRLLQDFTMSYVYFFFFPPHVASNNRA